MAGRRTNLALIVLLVAAFITGILAYGIGTGWSRWVTAGHGIAGFAIILLAPWKSVIARRGLTRSRPGKPSSIALAFAAAMALMFGLLHSTGLLVSFGAITAMQVHVGAALVVVPLAILHIHRRRVRPHRTDLSRRQLAKAGVLLIGAGATYTAAELALRVSNLPGARRRATGSYERGSFVPEEMPVTQWLNDSVPMIDGGRWELLVGAGDEMRATTLEELGEYDDRVRATLDCTGGWFSHQDWEGVWLSRLLPNDVGGRSITVRSVTGYDRRFDLSDAGELLIATRVGGEALSAGHGGPARLVAPGRRGFWWVKWLSEISVGDAPSWAQWPFPIT